MKILLISLSVLTFIAGCASSSKKSDSANSYSSVALEAPGDQSYQISKVYIDSVKKITKNEREALLIHGTFPDACTKLEEVKHQLKDTTLYLDFRAWRNPETMCAQVLTPFTYIYDKLDEEELNSHSKVIINDTAYNY